MVHDSIKGVMRKDSNSENPALIGGELMKYMAMVNIQARVWHLQTTSFAQHKALNEVYDAIGDFQDTLIETLQGYYNVRIAGDMNFTIDSTFEESKPAAFLKEFNDYMHNISKTKTLQPSCLSNIIDEITAFVSKAIYLLTLN